MVVNGKSLHVYMYIKFLIGLAGVDNVGMSVDCWLDVRCKCCGKFYTRGNNPLYRFISSYVGVCWFNSAINIIIVVAAILIYDVLVYQEMFGMLK